MQVTGTILGYEGRWGYIDQTGKVVIPPNSGRMISDSNGEESAFHDGLAMIEVEDKAIPPRKGFIDKGGKLVIPARFTTPGLSHRHLTWRVCDEGGGKEAWRCDHD